MAVAVGRGVGEAKGGKERVGVIEAMGGKVSVGVGVGFGVFLGFSVGKGCLEPLDVRAEWEGQAGPYQQDQKDCEHPARMKNVG